MEHITTVLHLLFAKLYGLLAMIILISILILVHELGHFIMARLCNVRVTRFGIGLPIGPSKKLFKWNKTTFYLHSFLFGGYVSFADDYLEENLQKQKNNQDFDEDEILPKDSDELYENKSTLQKLMIVSAGVFMNIVFGLLFVILAASIYHKLPATSQNIYINGFSDEVTSNFSEFEPHIGDKFYKINDNEIKTFYALTFYAKNSKLNDDYAQRNLIEQNKRQLVLLNPNVKTYVKKGQIIVLPKMYPEKPLKVSDKVLSGLEKYKKDGIKLNEKQIELRDFLQNKKSEIIPFDTTINDIAIALSDTYKPLNITILRDNDFEITYTDVKIFKEGILGVKLKVEDIYVETKNIKDILSKSIEYSYNTTKTMLQGLWSLVSGKANASDMHGIIAIVKVGGDIIVSKGMLNGLLLTAMISINLAIINFLPIPALDGGHVAFLIIEKITGRKITKETVEKINNFFFILLIILMIVICYNDIFALITKKF